MSRPYTSGTADEGPPGSPDRRRSGGGLWVRLMASYAVDPKVLDLDDERAELLYLRALAYSKLHVLDGVIHRRALARFAPFTDEVRPVDLAAELVRVGLWEVTADGWRITAWLKHNRSVNDLAAERSKGSDLAHRRWHVARGVVKPGCPFCDEEAQVNADACATQYGTHYVDAMPELEPEPELETEREPEKVNPAVNDEPASLDLVAPPSSADADRVRLIFDEWVTVTGRQPNRTRLDDKRRRVIRKALDHYPVNDLLDAVRGWQHSPHHRGENDRGTVYNDLTLLLRNAEQIEKFRDLWRRPPKAKGRTGTDRNMAALRRAMERKP